LQQMIVPVSAACESEVLHLDARPYEYAFRRRSNGAF
jgi:hypothetical protein